MNMDRRTALLRHAEFLVRTRGYSGFSYADLAESVSIRKASVHHHFPTKQDLGVTLVKEYLDRFQGDLDQIYAKEMDAKSKLTAYSGLFANSLREGMLPLCAALSAESSVLPESMKPLVSNFFEIHLAWLRRVINDGISAGELRADKSTDRSALLLLSTLEGGCLIGWAVGDDAALLPGFEEALAQMLV